MNATLVRTITLIGVLLVLGSVNYSLYAKEQIKRNGEIVYLELAPVDPRSLMQGDYMALRFAVARDIEARRRPGEEFALLRLDSQRIARMPEAGSSSGTLRMHYRMRGRQVWLGTNAYFFEEGSAGRFTAAKYGKFRVDSRTGEAVLVALCDAQLQEL
jgi:uncharacterized membrane-anchored protein